MAFGFLVTILIGAFIFWGGEGGLTQAVRSFYGSIATFVLVPVPLFILLGEIIFHSGMARQTIDSLDMWIGHIPGRLGLLGVGMGTLFATLSGSSIGSTAMLGKLLIPEMEERGYKKPMSIGPILGSGGLAMIIPPTALGVLLASLAKISVGQLLMAGIFPGLVLATLMSGYIIIRCRLQPSIAPPYKVAPTPWSKKVLASIRYILPLGTIIFSIIGLIFLGIATPSEAAATGALTSIILAAGYRRLNWEVLKRSFLGTVQITSMIFVIIMGAMALGQILAFSGATQGLVALMAGLPLTPIFLVLIMQFILIILGCFIDAISMVMITIPVYMPIIHALGINPLWFGLLMLLNMELAQITPPFGILLYTMKGIAPPDTTMGDVYRASLPFVMCDLVAMGLIMVFPAIALWLPGTMG